MSFSEWSTDPSANKFGKSYYNGFVDISGDLIIRSGQLDMRPNHSLHDYDTSSFKFDLVGGSGTAIFDVPTELNLKNHGKQIVTFNSNGFSAISKSFSIPHPFLENTKLRHSNVETPELKNMYMGRSQMQNGSIMINLDDQFHMSEGTFEAINKEAYTVTTNESDFEPVKGNVSGNILEIVSQDVSSNAEVSWIVFAKRNDIAIQDTSLLDASLNYIAEFPKVEYVNE